MPDRGRKPYVGSKKKGHAGKRGKKGKKALNALRKVFKG